MFFNIVNKDKHINTIQHVQRTPRRPRSGYEREGVGGGGSNKEKTFLLRPAVFARVVLRYTPGARSSTPRHKTRDTC